MRFSERLSHVDSSSGMHSRSSHASLMRYAIAIHNSGLETVGSSPEGNTATSKDT